MLRTMPVVFLLGVGCGGGAGNGATCAAQVDCNSALVCAGPQDTACTTAPLRECASNADCASGVCHAVADPCSAYGVGSKCADACGSMGTTTCDADFTCSDPMSGSCIPKLCTDNAFTCTATQVCKVGSQIPGGYVYNLSHGCSVVVCTGDADCKTGQSCVNGYCQTAAGKCAMPPS
jgi:hypothetical protein